VAQEDAELKHAVALSQAMEEQRLKAICEEVLPAPCRFGPPVRPET
jgi:hypothetical protein